MSGDLVRDPYRAALGLLLDRIDYERAVPAAYNDQVYKLDRMRELLARLGHPEQRLKIVHVAGTKGKGSTSAILAAALTATGHRTGLFTSPHLDRMEERIAVDGRPLAPDELIDLASRVRPAVEAMDAQGPVGPTFFDVTTALALLHFARRGVDAAVLEVGLGGRLDSTNVCTPLVSVITSISFDHMRQLGGTLDRIAREKAGIIKLGVPVVSGAVEPEPRDAIRAVAAAQSAPLVERDRDFSISYRPALDVDLAPSSPEMDFNYRVSGRAHRWTGLKLGLLGRHQADNAAVALAALTELRAAGWSIPESAVREALAHVRWPARVELIGRRPAVVIDSAHNVASAAALVEALRQSFTARPRTLVFATTQEKDAAGMLRLLLPEFDRVVLTRYASNPRSVALDELRDIAAAIDPRPPVVLPGAAEAWEHVRRTVGPDELVCVAGSLFIAAEMRAAVAGRPLICAAAGSA
jgi:dihydrofolate synthase/folylpolyglutamate synthase